MKLIIIFSLFIIQIIGNEIISDYLPITEAHITLQQIKTESQKYKDLISQNITTDFDNCVDLLKLNECYLIDDWQNEIEKRKLENDNSIKTEVPFLKQRKAEKQQKLKEFIEIGTHYDGVMLSLVEQLKAEQQDFVKSNWEIQQLYKLPEDTIIELIQKNKQIDVVHALNSNSLLLQFIINFVSVPRVAENEVRKAKTEYDIGDISIQAQTVSQEMASGYIKLDSTLKSVDEAFTLTQTRIQKEKDKLTEDITRVRALLSQEGQLQQKNLEKIAELEQQILTCQEFPKNVYKDCAPLKINAQKRLTKMEILETRTDLLFKEIDKIMKENQSLDQIEAQKQATKAMEEADMLNEEEESYVEGQAAMVVSEQPKELNPKHHLKEKVE